MAQLGEIAERYLATHEVDDATRRALGCLLVAQDPFARASPLHLTGSALVVHRTTGRVLLRYHEGVGAWIQLGGHGDAGERDPFEVAWRESIEESGLEDLVAPEGGAPAPEQLALVAVKASAGASAHQHLDLRYLLLTETPESARPEAPSAPLRWVGIGEAPRLCAEENLRPLFRARARLCGIEAPHLADGAADPVT